MATTGPSARFVYSIPIPSAVRVLAASVAVALFALLFGIPFIQLGAAGMAAVFRSDPASWAFAGATVGTIIAFFLVLAFSPRSWRAEVEFGHDRICLVPRRAFRWIDEPCPAIVIPSGAQEILICNGHRDNSPYGFRVFVRKVNVADQEFRAETGDNLNFRQSQILTKGVVAATNLPVHLIEHVRTKSGAVREIPWTPARQSMQTADLARLTGTVLPFAGGVVVGCLWPEAVIVLTVGIVLWSIRALWIYRYSREPEPSHLSVYERLVGRVPQLAAPNWFTAFFNFAFAYAVAFALADIWLHKH